MNGTKARKVLDFLQEVKKDCLNLRQCQDLTDYGQGQLDLINQILRARQ